MRGLMKSRFSVAAVDGIWDLIVEWKQQSSCDFTINGNHNNRYECFHIIVRSFKQLLGFQLTRLPEIIWGGTEMTNKMSFLHLHKIHHLVLLSWQKFHQHFIPYFWNWLIEKYRIISGQQTNIVFNIFKLVENDIIL